jgi:hypothetical protein
MRAEKRGQDQSLTSWEGMKTHLRHCHIHKRGGQSPDDEGQGEVHFFGGVAGESIKEARELTTSFGILNVWRPDGPNVASVPIHSSLRFELALRERVKTGDGGEF